MEQFESVLVSNLRQLVDIFNGRIEAGNLADDAVETAKIEDGAVTAVKVADGVAKIASGDYVGDGVADRVISVGFTPRFVQILRTDNSTEFYSIRSSASTRAWWRSGLGVSSNGAADWQGAVAGGFKSGSDADGGDSNIDGVTYSYYCTG